MHMSNVSSNSYLVFGALLFVLIAFSLPKAAAAASTCRVVPASPTPTRFESPNDPNWKAAIGAAGKSWNQR